jgi:hypothetical protein
MSAVRHRTLSIDGLGVLVREAGDPTGPLSSCCPATPPAPVPWSG